MTECSVNTPFEVGKPVEMKPVGVVKVGLAFLNGGGGIRRRMLEAGIGEHEGYPCDHYSYH